MADIFVSYTLSDRDWAFWIGHELEALDHKPHIHEWEIKGGDTSMVGWKSSSMPPAMCSASSRTNT
jgi:hypothetical protein